jgi:hypothetical protein
MIVGVQIHCLLYRYSVLRDNKNFYYFIMKKYVKVLCFIINSAIAFGIAYAFFNLAIPEEVCFFLLVRHLIFFRSYQIIF